MLTPPPRHRHSRPLSGPPTEVQNWLRHNILRDRVLTTRDRLFDPLKSRFPYCLFRWRVIPAPILPYSWLPPRDQSSDPVLETIQSLLHTWGKYPHLCPEQQQRLRHQFIEISRHFRICPLPSQYPREPTPTLSCLPKVVYHRKLVIISRCQYLSQVSKRRYHLQRLPVCLEGPL